MRNFLFCVLLTLSFNVAAIPMDLTSQGEGTVSDTLPEKAKQSYADGIQALTEGKLNQAKASFEASLKSMPGAYALLGLAEVAFKQDRMSDAQQYIQQAVELSPDDPHAQISLGRLYFTQGRYLEAESAFKKAVQSAPRLGKTYIALGDLYMMALKKPEQAIISYKMALEIMPEHAGAHYALGVAYLRSGTNSELAKQELKHAARLEPKNPLPKQMLARLYAANKQYDRALDVYSELLQQYPDLASARFGRGNVYLVQNKLDLAEKEFKAITRATPGNVEAWMKLGLVYQTQKHFVESEKAYLTALKLQPDIAIAYNNLAWMSANQKQRLDQSLKWARRAVDLNPDFADFHDTLGWVYKTRKEYKQAISAFQQANKIRENPQTYYHLGLVYMEKGDKQQAKNALQKALGMNSDFSEAEEAQKLLKRL